MACIVSYRAFFTENGKNRRMTKSPAGIPLKQIERSNEEYTYPKHKVFSGEKSGEAGQDGSWSLHDVEGAKALPRDMIGIRSEVPEYAQDPKV
ncbi:MAG: hypothetical protein Q9169_007508, partial [Polycauliona sp. 2 TL-2023]